MKKKSLSLALLGGLFFLSGPVSADAPVSGPLLAYQCAGCHGFNGHSVGPATPSIGGLNKDYFVQTMLDYKEGRRFATVMDRIAWGYTKEEIEAMGDFFSQQPFVPARQSFDPERAARGAEIHSANCNNCHSEGGTFAEPEAGLLAGQWMPFLQYRFEDFLERGDPQPRGMERRLSALSPDNIQDLLHYYASQQDPAAFAH